MTFRLDISYPNPNYTIFSDWTPDHKTGHDTHGPDLNGQIFNTILDIHHALTNSSGLYASDQSSLDILKNTIGQPHNMGAPNFTLTIIQL